jgi:molybdopterin/thiamine biosynthesis adenylyltransferase
MSLKFKNVFLLGCGGTGSQLAPCLVNLMLSNPTSFQGSTLWFIDPDVIESKNLLRQGFLNYEKGSLKAFSLACRYSTTLSTKYLPVGFNIETAKALLDTAAPNPEEGLLFICAVDNYQARRLSLEKLSSHGYSNYLWISPGNRAFSGQVISYLVQDSQELSISPLLTHPEIANAIGPGLSSTGESQGCGTEPTGGMQHFLSNMKAAHLTIQMLSSLIEDGVYFTDMWFEKFSTEYSSPIQVTLQ